MLGSSTLSCLKHLESIPIYATWKRRERVPEEFVQQCLNTGTPHCAPIPSDKTSNNSTVSKPRGYTTAALHVPYSE